MKKKISKYILCFLISILLLVAGGIIYLYFRQHTLYMFSWLNFFHLESYFQQLSFNTNSKIISFCIYSLPEGLYATSAIIIIGLLWKDSKIHFFSYSLIFIIGHVVFEFLQLFSIINGTFDFLDILVLMISLSIGILTYKFILHGGSYES